MNEWMNDDDDDDDASRTCQDESDESKQRVDEPEHNAWEHEQSKERLNMLRADWSNLYITSMNIKNLPVYKAL